MRIDPDSPRAKAKMRALDKLTDMLDYSRTGSKKSASDREVAEIDRDVQPSEVTESQHLDQDHNPDDYIADSVGQMKGRTDDDKGYGSPPDDLDNDNDDYMEEKEPSRYYKEIDMRDRRDSLKSAAADLPDGPLHNDMHGNRIKKHNRR